MLYKTLSAAVYGIDANLIEVEVDIAPSQERRGGQVHHRRPARRRGAREPRAHPLRLKNSGYDIPPTITTINLAPADIRKEGSGFDLPMALGILGAYGGINNKPPEDALFVGELSLDGGVRGIRGALPIAVMARANKIRKLIVPEVNAREAAVVEGVEVYPVRSLMEVVQLLNTGNGIQPLKVDTRALLEVLAAVRRRLPRCSRAADRQARHRSRRRRRAQPADDRPARLRQDHARQAHGDHPARR